MGKGRRGEEGQERRGRAGEEGLKATGLVMETIFLLAYYIDFINCAHKRTSL